MLSGSVPRAERSICSPVERDDLIGRVRERGDTGAVEGEEIVVDCAHRNVDEYIVGLFDSFCRGADGRTDEGVLV